jgi:CheY-like chemotaxis protein
MRVLVVDDEPSIRQLLADLLEGEGYLVTEAVNGRSALELLRRERTDAIVLDLMMPFIDGREFVRQYYAQSRGRPAPILLTSASPTLPQIAAQLGAFGVQAHIAKPFDVFRLLDAVAHLTEPTEVLAAAH